jgi:uncharacterized protein (TIGR03437 family)
LVRHSAILLALIAPRPTSLLAQTYDVATTFEQGWTTKTNPNGVWSYGYSSSFTSPITLYTQTGSWNQDWQYWVSPANNIRASPAASFNDGPAFDDGNVNFLANQLVLVSGIGGEYSNLVFTAPLYGVYSVAATFRGNQYGVGTVVAVLTNGTMLFNSSVTAEGQTVPFNAAVSLNAGDTIVFSVGPPPGQPLNIPGTFQNTGLSATITSLTTGYVNPKYLIMGVTYAPPGGNSSSVSYQNSNLVGNGFTETAALSAGVACTLMSDTKTSSTRASSTSSSCGIPGFSASATATVSQSSGWTQKTTNSSQITISKTNSTTLKTPGVPNVYSPVNHDYDIIWLWLNPLVLFAFPNTNTGASGSIVWSGYGYDLNDQPDMDVVGIYVGYLNGDFGVLDAQGAGTLSRSWVKTQTFAPGQGPGITNADYPNILRADPFAYNPFDSNSGYTLKLASQTSPPTSTDGRFTLSVGSTSPQSVPYQQAPLNSTQGIQDTYQITNQTTRIATQVSDYTYTVSWGLEEKFTAGFVFANVSADFAQKWTLTWENAVTNATTLTSTQIDTAQITGPPCPATTAPCNPTYTEPHEFAIYQDNLYGSLMFWPNPYFSISALTPTTATTPAGAAASYMISTLANAGYTGTSVRLSVTGLPVGASYTQGAVAPGSTFVLSVSTASSTPTGSYPLTISATDGSQSYFAYATLVVGPAAAPLSLSVLAPSSATAGGPAFTLTVNGSGFLSGSTVQWTGQPLTTTYVSANLLTAAVSSNLIAAQGTAAITVTNPGGTVSNSISLLISAPTPTISSLNPNSATVGGPAFLLAVSGSGFLTGSVVQWNGSALSSNYVSGTQLTALVPGGLIASQGMVSVTALNPGGVASPAATFTLNPPIPTISSLSPNSAPAGSSAFTLTVNGAGYLSGSVVQWNGTALATNYVSGSQLTASVSTNLVASSGSAAVTVVNQGGTASAALTFTISSSGGLSIITTSPLATGTVGVPYSQALAATGGVSPYKGWTVINPNDLPPGISLTPLGGVLTTLLIGTPTTTGTSVFTVQVTDNSGATATKQLSLTVNGGAVSISANGIVNAASYAGGSVSPGEIVTIFGSGLGPNTLVGAQLDSRGYVTTSLAQTQVLFDGVDAPMIYTLAGQVSAVVPYEVSGKSTTQVQVVYQGQSSNLVSMPVSTVIPGIFTSNASGTGPGAIINQNGTVNTASNPASAGTYVFVYATGEGQTNPAGVDGEPGGSPVAVPVAQPVTATVGGLSAQVQYAGGAPGLVAGVCQVNILIPLGASAGSSIPIVINIGGRNTQANVTLAVK